MSVTKKIAKWFSNHNSKESPSSRLRAKRIAPLLGMIDDVFNEYGHVNIIDIGGTEIYWENVINRKYLEERHVNITIINL